MYIPIYVYNTAKRAPLALFSFSDDIRQYGQSRPPAHIIFSPRALVRARFSHPQMRTVGGI